MNNRRVTVYKIGDICLKSTKYELHIDGKFYTSNISIKQKEKLVNKFISLGYTISNKSNYFNVDQQAVRLL